MLKEHIQNISKEIAEYKKSQEDDPIMWPLFCV